MLKVSIITPTYNHERFIGQCIEGVLSQTYQNWEQIIIDDGSTDETAAIVRSYSDPRIKYIRQSNRGIESLAHSYNTALKASSGDVIAILEGDDTCPADKLERSIEAFTDPQNVLVYGEVQELTMEGALVKANRHTRIRRQLPSAILMNDPVGSAVPYMLTIKGHSMVAPASVLIRRTTLEEMGGFQYVPGMCLTDFPTFFGLALKGKFHYIPHVLGFRRMHSSSVSFQYLSNISSTQQKYVFTLLQDERLPLTEKQRKRVSKEWRNERPDTEFTRGRLNLLRREWKIARRDFQRAMSFEAPQISVAAALGWILSWLHRDLEYIMSASGRVPLKHKDFDADMRDAGSEDAMLRMR